MTIDNTHSDNFMHLFDLTTLINSPTCYLSHNPTNIDHFLTNQKALLKFSKTTPVYQITRSRF